MPQLYVYIYKDENLSLSMKIKKICIYIYLFTLYHKYMENKFKYITNASEQTATIPCDQILHVGTNAQICEFRSARGLKSDYFRVQNVPRSQIWVKLDQSVGNIRCAPRS